MSDHVCKIVERIDGKPAHFQVILKVRVRFEV